MINPLVQIQRAGFALEAATQRNPRLLPTLAAVLIALAAAAYGALLAAGAPMLYMLVAPLGLVALWLVFTLPEYAALMLLAFRWGFIFDALDGSIGLQSPSLPLGMLLLIVLAVQVVGPQRRKIGFDPIILLLLVYFGHVAFGVWYAREPNLVTTRVIDFAKDIIYTLVVAYWLIKPRIFAGAIAMMVLVGALLGTLTVYQEVTQTYDNSYWDLAKVRIAQIVEGVEDRPRASGPVGDPNFYGQQMLVLLPLAFWWTIYAHNGWMRLAAMYSTLAIIAGIGLSYSRGALLAVAFMGAVYFIRFKIQLRYLLYLIPLVIIAAIAAPPELRARFSTLTQFAEVAETGVIEEDSLANRTRYLVVGGNMFLDDPILGKGAQHFKAFYSDYVLQIGLSPERDQNRNAHNYYLEVLTEHGLIGLGLVLAMIVLAWRRFGEGQRLYLQAGDQQMADLGGFLQVALSGYALSAFFLHGDYPRFLWLFLGMAVAFGFGARTMIAADQSAADIPAASSPSRLDPSGA